MTEKKQKVQLPESPFPGIDPFNYAERNVFFAREQESRALIRLVVIHRGVLLYADSGTGKSSLINAGLLPHAVAEGFQPERLRVQPRQDEEIIVERLSENSRSGPPFLPSIFSSDEEEERVVLPVASFLETIKKKAQSARPLLIFDQFEEWFTLFEEGARGKRAGEAQAAQDTIRDAILSLLREPKLPVKILLVLREDYLAKLTPFFKRYPNLPDQYLRLTALKGTGIKRIIRGPFEDYLETYEPEIPAVLAQKVRKEFESRSGGEPVRLSEVQIVCRTLYESGKAADELEAYFDDHGGVQGILEKYLKQALESLPKNQRDPAVGLLSRMVTAAGTRNVISGEDVISRVENEDKISRNILGKTLDSLEQETKLVRRERRREVYYYEISSEFLVQWIRAKARERAERLRIAEKERELLEEKKKAEEQARIAAKLRKRAVALLLISLLAVIIAVLAGLAFIDADEQKVRAQYQQVNASFESLQAGRAKVVADFSTAVADSAKNKAQQERQKTVSLVFATKALELNELYGATKDSSHFKEKTLAGLLALWAFRFDSTASRQDTSANAGYFPNQIYKALQQSLSALDSTARKPLINRQDWINSVVLSPQNEGTSWLAASSADDSVKFGKVPIANNGKLKDSPHKGVRVVAVSEKTLASGGEDTKVLLWNLENDKKDITLNVNYQVWSLAFSRTGDSLAIGGASKNISLYNRNDSKWSLLDSIPMPKVGIRSLAFSPNGKRLAACGLDGIVRIWKMANPRVLADSVKPDSSSKGFRTVAFSTRGDTLLIGGIEGGLKLVALQADRYKDVVHPWQAHKERVNSVAFQPKGALLASGSADGTVKLWNLRDLMALDRDTTKVKIPNAIVLREHDSWVWSVAFSSDGNSIFSSTSAGTVRRWAASPYTLSQILARKLKVDPKDSSLVKAKWKKDAPDFHFETYKIPTQKVYGKKLSSLREVLKKISLDSLARLGERIKDEKRKKIGQTDDKEELPEWLGDLQKKINEFAELIKPKANSSKNKEGNSPNLTKK